MHVDKKSNAAVAVLGFVAGAATGRFSASPQARFARQAGSTIAGRDAAGWITDFLNAVYYRHAPEEREIEALRLAWSILTTRWNELGGRRLHTQDVAAFHRAFGRARFLDASRSRRGTVALEQLYEGASVLHGGWFRASYEDDARRGWGIAFRSEAERAAYEPERRLRLADLGPLTPGVAPMTEQTWHTYAPVPVPSADAVIAALSRPETWPDYSSELGRFTPLRSGGLADQTFEVEVVAGAASVAPVTLRGYVTITRVVSSEEPAALASFLVDLETGLASQAGREERAIPEGGTARLAFDLTTHESHFMGRGRNRLLLFEHEGRAWVRAAGTWDPMPWHLRQGYERAGRDAQSAFWGETTDERQSMLHQVARAVR